MWNNLLCFFSPFLWATGLLDDAHLLIGTSTNKKHLSKGWVGTSHIHLSAFTFSLSNKQYTILTWLHLADNDADWMVNSDLQNAQLLQYMNNLIPYDLACSQTCTVNESTSCLLSLANCLKQDRGKLWHAALQLEHGMICTLKRCHSIDLLFGRREKLTGGTGRPFQMSDDVLPSGWCALVT